MMHGKEKAVSSHFQGLVRSVSLLLSWHYDFQEEEPSEKKGIRWSLLSLSFLSLSNPLDSSLLRFPAPSYNP